MPSKRKVVPVSRKRKKPKYQLGQVVCFIGSRMIYCPIAGIHEAGEKRELSVYRNGVRVRCTENLLRPLTASEKGPE